MFLSLFGRECKENGRELALAPLPSQFTLFIFGFAPPGFPDFTGSLYC
jgi:hypothetical protein